MTATQQVQAPTRRRAPAWTNERGVRVLRDADGRALLAAVGGIYRGPPADAQPIPGSPELRLYDFDGLTRTNRGRRRTAHGWERIDRSDEGGFLAEGGWHVESAGSTGLPPGRPTKGMTRAALLGAELLERCGVHDVAELAGAWGKGADPVLRARLAAALGEGINRRERPWNVAALARLLGRSRKAIYALARLR